MSDTSLLIRGPRPKPVLRMEIARSFSYKLDMKRYDPKWYENRDFFCSAKAECAFEDAEEVAASLFQFCKAQILADLKVYIREVKQHLKEVA